jgi:hypothetical protein
MKPLNANASLACLLGALLLLGLVWSLTGPLGEGALPIANPRVVAPRPAAAVVPKAPMQPCAPVNARTAIAGALAQAATTVEPASESAMSPSRRVRVRGNLRCQITPVPDRAITFLNIDFPKVQDWDFTDEAGRYEVDVPPGRYDVVSDADDRETWLARVNVPAGSDELALDLEVR